MQTKTLHVGRREGDSATEKAKLHNKTQTEILHCPKSRRDHQNNKKKNSIVPIILYFLVFFKLYKILKINFKSYNQYKYFWI